MMPLSAGSKHIAFALEQTMPSSLLPPLQKFVFRPDPLHQTDPLSSKGWFPPTTSSLFENIQQRFRFGCPIFYSSLTTHRQWEQALLRVPAQVPWCLKMHCNREQQQLPSAGKVGYIGTGKAICLEPHTFIKSGETCRKHAGKTYLYVALFQCQTYVC